MLRERNGRMMDNTASDAGWDGPPPTVVVVGLDPLNDWHKTRWGISYFSEKGLNVLYFNARRLIYPDWDFKGEAGAPQTEIPEFSDPAALRAALTGRNRVFVVSFVYLDEPRLRPVTDVFAALRLPCCQALTGLYPSFLPPEGMQQWGRYAWFQVNRAIRDQGVIGASRKIAGRLSRAAAPARARAAPPFRAQYVLAGATSAPVPPANSGATIIYGHVQDYEVAYQKGLLRNPPRDDICVFYDQGLVGHRDLLAIGATTSDLPDPQWYYAALFRCFETIQAATGLRVVAVPHPRFLHGMSRFGRYEVRPGDAIATAARARLIIGHFSAALGLGVIFDKPVIQLTSKVFVRCMGAYMQRGIRTMQRALGCSALSMDDPRAEDLQDWRAIDHARYAEYRRRYIKHPASSDSSIWDAIYQTIGSAEVWPTLPQADTAVGMANRDKT